MREQRADNAPVTRVRYSQVSAAFERRVLAHSHPVPPRSAEIGDTYQKTELRITAVLSDTEPQFLSPHTLLCWTPKGAGGDDVYMYGSPPGFEILR